MEYITEFLRLTVDCWSKYQRNAVSGLSPFGAVYVGMGWIQFMKSCGQ